MILMNKFLKLYYKKKKEYPETKGMLLTYLEDNNIDVDDLPQAVDGDVIYNVEKHKFYFQNYDEANDE